MSWRPKTPEEREVELQKAAEQQGELARVRELYASGYKCRQCGKRGPDPDALCSCASYYAEPVDKHEHRVATCPQCEEMFLYRVNLRQEAEARVVRKQPEFRTAPPRLCPACREETGAHSKVVAANKQLKKAK